MRFARTVGIVIFALVLAAMEWRQLALWRSADSLRQSETALATSELRARVERELNVVFNLSRALASYLEAKQGRIDPDELSRLLQNLYITTNHLHNIAIAVGYRVDYVYPQAGNEQVRGVDYRELSDQWPAIKHAIADHADVLAGPVALVQGGSALIYRVPVYIDGRYWGLVSSVIDASSLFGAAGDKARSYAIRSLDAHDTMIWGDSDLFDEEGAVVARAAVPGGEWEYVQRPLKLTPPEFERLMFHVIALMISALLGYFAYATQRHRHQLYNLSRIDSTTKLLNRRALESSLELVLERRRKSDLHCALLFIDLDRFKTINDTHGHRAGDAVLSAVAERLTRELRVADLVGRWGGDELVVFVEEGDRVAIDNLIMRLRRAIELPVMFGNTELHVGASIGCALFPEDGTTLETLLYIADIRMYQDKQRHYS